MILGVTLALAISKALPQTCQTRANWSFRTTIDWNRDTENLLSKKDGSLEWNGAIASEDLLRQVLPLIKGLSPRPPLIIEGTNLNCNEIMKLEDFVDSKYDCRGEKCYVYRAPDGHPALERKLPILVAPAPKRN